MIKSLRYLKLLKTLSFQTVNHFSSTVKTEIKNKKVSATEVKTAKLHFEDHYPVMYKNILKIIEEKFYNRAFIESINDPLIIGDMTLGCGNHSKLILEKFPNSKVIGLDVDDNMIKYTKEKLSFYIMNDKRLAIKNENYKNFSDVFPSDSFSVDINRKFDFVLLDLGFNSMQLNNLDGLSYSAAGEDKELDMRYNKTNDNSPKASDILNNLSELELIEIFHKYAEEKYSQLLVKNILKFREGKKFIKVEDLIFVINNTFKGKTIDKFNTYSRIFQALRIIVNSEIINLQNFLSNIISNIEPNGVLSIISFHSIEDKIVKFYFSEFSKRNLGKEINKHGILPDKEELEENSRSKSAVLRSYCFK